MEKTTFGLVGAGWRAEFFLRVATARPDFFGVSGIVVRNPEKARSVREKWDVARVRNACGDTLRNRMLAHQTREEN